jgi:hypothetical protein
VQAGLLNAWNGNGTRLNAVPEDRPKFVRHVAFDPRAANEWRPAPNPEDIPELKPKPYYYLTWGDPKIVPTIKELLDKLQFGMKADEGAPARNAFTGRSSTKRTSVAGQPKLPRHRVKPQTPGPLPAAAITPTDPSQPDGSNDLAILPPSEIAYRYGVKTDALRKRLLRYKRGHLEGFTETENRRPREAAVKYEVRAVWPVIVDLRRRMASKTSSERPAKRKS